jgi:hypothetical protein
MHEEQQETPFMYPLWTILNAWGDRVGKKKKVHFWMAERPSFPQTSGL